jgi:hypothetical protein
VRGPHCHDGRGPNGEWSTWEKCRFCGVEIKSVRWELCPKAPEIEFMPRIGQVWDLFDHSGYVRSTIVAVRNTGDWWWGHNGTCQSFYTYNHQKQSVNWPPEGAVLVRQVEEDPWLTGRPNRTGIVMGS